MEVAYFTPGQPDLLGPPLAPYRPETPVGALTPYLDAYTQPGDLVIDLFCTGPTLLREAAQAGRHALGINVNRALLLAASLGLTAVERQDVEAAFTRIAEARKGSGTLQAHIEGLYHTRCATCGVPTIADAFVWERDGQKLEGPVEKHYHCATCGDAQAPTDEADRAAAARFEARGLSYWLMLDRATPGDAPHRERAAALIDLYTPRNLSAISDLLLKSDGLTLTSPVRQVVDALLLDTFDQATSLRPPGAPIARPHRLRHPSRYVEVNVWHTFERTLESWRESHSTTISHSPIVNLQSPTLAPALHSIENAGVSIAPLATRQAARDLPPGSAALIIADPPRPDLALWHLTTLWCYWLWGQTAGAPLVHFFNRRRLDWDWFWRGLLGAFQAVAPLLRPEGRLVCLFNEGDPALLEALTLAIAGAGYELVGWGAQPPQVRLTYRFDKSTMQQTGTSSVPTPIEADSLSRAVAERVAETSLKILRERGEPVAWPMLHAAIYADLIHSSLLARAAELSDDVAAPLPFLSDTIRSALDGTPLIQMTSEQPETLPQPTYQLTRPRGVTTHKPLWWLDKSLEPQAIPPLSDRVELAVAKILRDLLAVTETDLHRRVCAHFPGLQTPDAHLVRLCLFSYGDEHAPGHWRLRAEDDFEARVAETDAVIADLEALGRRLGFNVVLGIPRAGEWVVRWLDETGHTPYAFAVRTTAVLGDLLFDPPPLSLSHSTEGKHIASPPPVRESEGGVAEPQATPCLTLPGGRAVLVGYKLRHDPRLRQAVKRHSWQFLKFRHLRHLVQEVTAKQLDRYAFRAALGLDPVVEQAEVQMSLW